MSAHSGRTLAYLGDAVFELMVRQYLIESGYTRSEDQHRLAVRFTSAEGQAICFRAVEQTLSDEEQEIVKRGRNTELSRKPRHAELHIYRTATGLETLLGHLYMHQRQDRIEALFEMMKPSIDLG